MKIKSVFIFKFSNAIILIFILSIGFITSEDLSNEKQLENNLINLLRNIKQLNKKKDDSNNEVTVKINKIIDLNSHFESLKEIKEKTEKDNKNNYNFIENRSLNLDKKNKEIQSRIVNLKDKFKNIIDGTNQIEKKLQNKKSLELQMNSITNSKIMDLDNSNTEFLYRAENLKKNFEKSSKKVFIEINRNLSNTKTLMDNRENSKKETQSTKFKENKIGLQFKLYKKLEAEQQGDMKLLNFISKSINDEAKNFDLNSLNSNAKIEKLNKIINDKFNMKKFEFEKEQQNEYSKEYSKQIKSLLKNNEKIQNDIKELNKKKNRMNLKLKKKEIESFLKKSSQKNEMKILNNQIKQIEEKIFNNIKKQKTYLLQNEIKIKNLLLILNKLLISNSKKKKIKNNSLEDLLFDKKVLDLEKGVNFQYIPEITQSILKE